MRTLLTVLLLVAGGFTVSAQIGAGDSLGLATPIGLSTVGGGDTLGTSSLPSCNPLLTPCAIALPVQLLEFDGHRLTQTYVQLRWKVTNEIAMDGYWVERSLGNPDNFSQDFFVPASTDSGLVKIYDPIDTNGYAGKSFYRLNELGMSGNLTYSNVIEVDGYAQNDLLKAYPNPSRGMVYLDYPAAASGQPYQIRVFDPFGRLVFVGQTTTVDLSHQSAGIYTIECLGDTVQHARVVIMR